MLKPIRLLSHQWKKNTKAKLTPPCSVRPLRKVQGYFIFYVLISQLTQKSLLVVVFYLDKNEYFKICK